MITLLEELKGRLEAAAKRLAVATQRFQAAQQELQSAQTECNVWTAAVNIETREENARTAAAAANQIPMPLTAEDSAIAPAASGTHLELESDATTPQESTNKTELVRELLRHHTGGMTPADLWKSAEGQISSRAYLYSILKRLRDRDEVTLRRKKYALKCSKIQIFGGEIGEPNSDCSIAKKAEVEG